MTSATQSSGVLALALRWNYFFSAALAVGVYFRLWLLPTAPWRSNSGNLFAGLIANILCGGVADQSNIEGVLPRLRAIFERLGCMESSSDDLFGQFHHPGGSHPQLRDDGANHRVPYDIHFLEIASSQCAIDMAFDFCSTRVLSGLVLVMGGHILPLGCYPPIQLVQHDVGKERRQDTALRRSLGRVYSLSIGKNDRRFQHLLDDAQQFFVPDAQFPHLPYQLSVVHIVKEAVNIQIDRIV